MTPTDYKLTKILCFVKVICVYGAKENIKTAVVLAVAEKTGMETAIMLAERGVSAVLTLTCICVFGMASYSL